MIKNLLGWVFLLVVLAGCTESAAPDPAKMGYRYYPIEVGDYRIYFVTNIRTQFDKGDTTRFFLREVVKSSFVDQTNTLNYRIERSLRPSNRSQWVADSVFVVTKSLTNVILTKDNTKRVKLVFPVKEDKTWAGDAYNNNGYFDPEEQTITHEPYSYEKVNQSFVFNDKHFIYNNTALQLDSTATVIQGEPRDDKIMSDHRKEVYAAGIGMVYRLFSRAVYAPCSDDACEFGEGYVLNGHERHEVLIEHGKL